MTGTHQPSAAVPARQPRQLRLRIPELWASLAISMMWVAVAVTALWGPDIVSSNGSQSQTTQVPSAIVVALFAYLGTRIVARYGLARTDEDR